MPRESDGLWWRKENSGALMAGSKKKNLEQIPHIMSETPSEAYIHCKKGAILQGHLVSTERGTSNPVVALLMAQG